MRSRARPEARRDRQPGRAPAPAPQAGRQASPAPDEHRHDAADQPRRPQLDAEGADDQAMATATSPLRRPDGITVRQTPGGLDVAYHGRPVGRILRGLLWVEARLLDGTVVAQHPASLASERELARDLVRHHRARHEAEADPLGATLTWAAEPEGPEGPDRSTQR